jgi:hypothetical protein
MLYSGSHHLHSRRWLYCVLGKQRRGGLQNGTAMPVGELQEGLHLRQGLPIVRAANENERRIRDSIAVGRTAANSAIHIARMYGHIAPLCGASVVRALARLEIAWF